MSENGSKSGGQGRSRDRALLALASGRTTGEAAAEAGVSERTVYRWREEPEFAAAVERLRAGMFSEATGRLVALANLAADRLRKLVESKNECVSLAACRAVLEAGMRLYQMVELDRRLAEVERKLAARRAPR